MLVGLDRLPSLSADIQVLQNSRVGLLAHPASVDCNLLHIHRVLEELGIRVRRIFGPEHGYGGESQDMIGVQDAMDPGTGAPIVSLYSDHFEGLSPRPDHLRELDILLVDLCDVGSRYYTYVWTALLALRVANSLGVRVMLLDRPNPIDGSIERLEGKFQEKENLSFVGLERIAVRHGLTIGELVAEMAAREGIEVGPGKALDVVTIRGWERQCDATAWDRPFVMPSPNMPTLDTATVYPGGCLLEGTNLSEGRGTTRPFEVFGAPWLDGKRLAQALSSLDLEGFVARPLTFQPTFHKYAGEVCGGLQIHVTDRKKFRPMAVYVAAIAFAAYQAPEAMRFRTEKYEFIDHIPAIDLLTGSDVFRKGVERGKEPKDLIEEICVVGEEEVELYRRAVQRVRDLAR